MELEIYAVYDEKAEAMFTPFFIQNEMMARRAFEGIIRSSEQIRWSPKDFRLMFLGRWDPSTGFITQDSPPEKTVGAWELQADEKLSQMQGFIGKEGMTTQQMREEFEKQ